MLEPARGWLQAASCWLAALFVVCAAGPVVAAVDLTDPWVVEINGGTFLTIRFIQSGTTLMTTVPPGGDDFVFAGTIDPDSGVFHLDATYIPASLLLCSVAIDATAAPDGQSFTGTFTYEEFVLSTPTQSHCEPPTVLSLDGMRCPTCTACGDGVIDGGEQCDDGNVASGDCCSATCTFESAGGTCASDFNQCTDDVCDGAGTCAHLPNSNPCGGTTCLPRTCSGGLCLGAAAPAGTACVFDAELCTQDACDGAGQCVGAARDDCLAAPNKTAIMLRKPGEDGRAVRWVWTDKSGATAASDLGDPTTSTDYHLCVFAGTTQLLLSAVAPAAGQCNGKDCWKVTRHGFTYRDRAGTADGLRSLRMRVVDGGVAKLSVSGKGANLPLTSSVAVPSVRAELLADDGAGIRCWQSDFDSPGVSTATLFKAKE